jgi:photosystem II stability/assembly factor-like uncharacterized protein
MEPVLWIPKYILIISLLSLPLVSYAQHSNIDTQEERRFDFRRIDPNKLPPIEKYAQPKEQVFPLHWRNSGTGVWTELNPRVPRVDYIGLHFVNKDTGWACGGSGAIIKTTNGGDDWTISETPVTNLLLKIHSYNGQVVIATGYDGIILRSSDGGENFVQVPSGVGNGIDLWDVKMINDTLGWVCGLNQTLLKTTDAGLTWQPISTVLNQHYWAVDFINEQYGMIACGDGIVLKSTDGGNTWTQIQAGDTRDLYSIDIIDSQHIVAAGEREPQIQFEGGKNVYSSDAGVTWIQNPDIPTYTDANWIEFVDRDTGYAITVSHGIYKTTNRGENWFSVGGGGEWQLDLTEDGTGYSGGDGLNIYKRINGLENWSKIFLNVSWSDVFFVNEMKGFFISGGVGVGIYKTEDGGISYQKIENTPSGYDLLFLDSLTGFIAGTHKTTDGGENWYQVNTGGGTKVFFINDSVGWSIGGNVINKSTDIGENWLIQFTAPIGVSFYGIHFSDVLYGWTANVSTRPYRTTDGGIDWIEQTNINIWDTRDIFFIDQQVGYLLGFNELYKTTDAGITWILNPNVAGFGIAKTSTYQDSTIFIIGGKIYRSLDGGENWYEFTELNGIGIKGLHLLNAGLGFAGGSGGLILKYYDTTYVPVELISFEAKVETDKIILEWITASELNNYGFEIQKSHDNNNWQKIGFVNGSGSTTEYNSYSFTDNSTLNEKNYYRLKQIDFNGTYKFSHIITVNIPINNFDLRQNYPNPFNPTTTIKYNLPKSGSVELIVYDILGRKVKTLVNENQQAGRYEINFNASGLATGVYIYQLRSQDFVSTKKMILLK